MTRDQMFRLEGVDGEGNQMAEDITVTLSRAEWWMMRNQLRNQADDWRDHLKVPKMAAKCDYLADQIDAVLTR